MDRPKLAESDDELRAMLIYVNESRDWPLDKVFWENRIAKIKAEMRRRGIH